MTQVLEAVQSLAALRRDYQTVTAEIDGAYATLEAAMEARLTRQTDLKCEIDALEDYVRHLGVSIFEATGKKEPAPGLSIRMTTSVEYDEGEALAWCLDQRIAHALRLQKAAFDKLASVMRPPFVTVREQVPATTIARDLEAALTTVHAHLNGGADA